MERKQRSKPVEIILWIVPRKLLGLRICATRLLGNSIGRDRANAR
jgi:hypothetical protein